jgi:cyclopropane fatty-acyl-phospholipid synthase-like methyltransferase
LIADELLNSDRFPRASAYHPEWVLRGASGGANALWLTEWLCEKLDLRPGMRVLDLGCGRAMSSIFLHREFGVEVWATDLWFSASENIQRVRDAGVQESVFPIAANARSLPFSEEFFDAVVSIDSFMFYGTDDLYLNYLARFVKPGGPVAIALAGFMDEVTEPIPEHLVEWWAGEVAHCMHSAHWWRQHWQRSGAADVAVADTLPNGWQLWRDWLKLIAPENECEIRTLEADAGRTFGYVRVVGHRRADAKLFDPVLTIPAEYAKKPLLR